MLHPFQVGAPEGRGISLSRKKESTMQTKILIIVGVSVASVVALFVMGFFLDKDASKKKADDK